MTKIFKDSMAKQRFLKLYEAMEEKERKAFANRCRELAKSKIETIDDNETDFYLTEKDVDSCATK